MHQFHQEAAKLWSECTACGTRFDFDPSSKTPIREQLKEQFDKHLFDGTCNVQTRDFPPKPPTK
jgi:hypothetical protein